MKKLLSLVLSLLLVSAVATGCTNTANNGDNPDVQGNGGENTTDANVIKIGIFEPQSGDNGAGGKQEMLGIQYANEKVPTVTIGDTEYKVELVAADNGSDNSKAPTAAQTLVSAGCSIVLGSYGSGVSIAASDTFKNGGVPAMGITCTNPQVTEGNTHYFRICFLDPFQGSVLANLAVEKLDAEKAYIITKLGDDYSTGLGYNFKKAFEELGGTVVEDSFQDGNSDFTAFLNSAKTQECDVIFAPTSTEAAQLIIEQCATLDINIPILAGDTWDSNVILNAAKGKNVDINVTTFYQEGGNEEFDKEFKEWINADATHLANNGGDDTISAVSVMGYDAYFVALEAIKAAGSPEPAKVMEALPSVSYTGVTGLIEFDETGDAKRDAAFVKKANTETGAWDFVAEQGIGK